MKNQKNYCARTDIYNMMIRLNARHNRTDQARGLFFEMQEWRYRDFLCCKLLLLVKLHSVYLSFMWMNHMRLNFALFLLVTIQVIILHLSYFSRCKPDAETYNALINAHGKAGQWRWAMNIMEDMLRAAVCTLYFSSLNNLSWSN